MIETAITRSPEVVISHVKLRNMQAMIDISNDRHDKKSCESVCNIIK